MIIDVKVINKSKEGALVVEKNSKNSMPYMIPWTEFNTLFNKSSWENHFWVEFDDVEFQEGVEKISFLMANIEYFTKKGKDTVQKIKEYYKLFGDNQEDFMAHVRIAKKIIAGEI